MMMLTIKPTMAKPKAMAMSQHYLALAHADLLTTMATMILASNDFNGNNVDTADDNGIDNMFMLFWSPCMPSH